jgi:1,2-diacylglycerol 3-alpha-glucosyltransferase
MMRIAVASAGLGHVTRGIEAWGADLAHALHGRGVSVVLFKGGGTKEASYERVVPCLRRGSPRTARLLQLLPRRFFWRIGLGSPYSIEQMTFALSLLTHLRTEAIDILHVQDSLVALIVQRARRIGLVRTLTILGHGTSEHYDFLQKITYLQHLAPHHLDEARKVGFWKPTWTAIPNFVDIDLFRPGRADALRAELGIPDDAIVLLTAAAIKRDHKRIDYLLDEFARFMRINPQLPARLVVAGGREADTDDLVQQGRKSLGDRVCFQVQYPRDRMPELYRLADVFALCSLSEMMPIALIEATASGLPCVVHRDPVCQWIAGPGGDSIDMSVPGALATALEPFFEVAGRRRTRAQLARQHCVENFSQDRVVDQIIAYYRFVLGNHRSRPETESVAAGAGTVLSAKVVRSVDCTSPTCGYGNLQTSASQTNA